MNEETKIQLQAYLDGELSGRDAQKISELLNKDSDAQSLLAELKFIKSALHGNELELKLPETREFYWSKIHRGIERGEKIAPRATASWWKPIYARFAGGLAATCALLMISFIAFNNGAFNNGTSTKFASIPAEIEGNGEMGAITYHSNSDSMTVVYLFDREPNEMIDSESN